MSAPGGATRAAPSAYLRPATLAEAIAARAAHPAYRVLAGGTDLMVAAHRQPAPGGIIDLFGLAEITGVRSADAGVIEIGAATTYAQLLASDLVRRELPALWAACREIGAAQIQSRGTIGGNIATSSPVGDTLPVLLALDAELELCSAAGSRRVLYRDFCVGYRETVLGETELIARVVVPPRPRGTVQYWRKVGPRAAQAISKVMMAGALLVDAGRIHHARIAFGAMADRPVRVPAVEEVVTGAVVDDALVMRARQELAKSLAPIDDVRSTAAYRLAVAQNLLTRCLRSLPC